MLPHQTSGQLWPYCLWDSLEFFEGYILFGNLKRRSLIGKGAIYTRFGYQFLYYAVPNREVCPHTRIDGQRNQS